jgi:ribose transport system substrate-binding protein
MRSAARALALTQSVLILLAVSCGSAPHAGEHYVFVASNIDIPYWQQAKSGFTDSSKDLKGATAEFVGPSRYDPDAELTAFQNAVSSHPTGILVSPGQADLFRSAIDDAVAAGIPVVCVDSDSPRSKRVLFIGTDNYRAGMESGEAMAEILHGHGHVVVVAIPGQHNQDERMRGVNDAIKKYPFMRVGNVVNDSGDVQSATNLISGLFQNNVEIEGIICLEASGGAGAAKALDQASKSGQIPIVAMDANPDTLNYISGGRIAATVAQKPYTMAYFGLQFLDDLHHNRVHEFPDWRTAPVSPLPSVVDTGTVLVNSGNLQNYLAATARPKS